MKLFELKSVKYGGKAYKGCVLALDEGAGQGEVTRRPRRLFGSKPVSVAKFAVDSKTSVIRAGESLTVGSLEMTASDLADAASILTALEAPRKAALELAEKALALAEERAAGFLKTRGEALAFLEKLRRDPAETMLELYVAKRLPAEVTLGEVRRSQTDSLVAALDGLTSALADLEAKSSPQVSERVYAVTYVGGLVQDNLFQRGQPGLESEPFLAELGIKDTDIAPPFEDLPVRLVAASHASTSALLR